MNLRGATPTDADAVTATYAPVVSNTSASVALHESVGFVPIGVYRMVGFKLGA